MQRRCRTARAGLALALACTAWGFAGQTRSATAASGAVLARTGDPAHAVPACQSCHSAHGEGQPEGAIPRLAGLDAGYMARQLSLLAAGTRRNGTMTPVAMALSTEARAAVSAYYAALPPQASPGPAAAAADVAHGQALADVGRWKVQVPPCASCHGPQGLGVGAVTPALAGQPATYIEAAMNSWRGGSRGGDPLGLMAGIARRLSVDDIRAAAAYYAAQPVAPPAHAESVGRPAR